MKKRMAALALALTIPLVLFACGGETKPRTEGVLGGASGIEPDAVLLTVDGREVSAGQYLYWLADACGYIRTYYQTAGRTLDWEEPLGGGTLADYAKNQALRSAALYATVENWAEQYGCVLTEEDHADLDSRREAWLKEAGELGLGTAAAEQMAEDHYLYNHLCGLAATEGSALWASQEELAAFARERGGLTVDLLLISKAGAEDQAARDQRRQQAEALFARLNQSTDPAAEFAALRREYSQAAGDYPCTIIPGETALPEEFVAAAQTLEEGQLSGIVEAEVGYGILLRLPTSLDAFREDWFDSRLQTAADGAAVELTETYTALSVPAFCAGLDRLRTGGSGT